MSRTSLHHNPTAADEENVRNTIHHRDQLLEENISTAEEGEIREENLLTNQEYPESLNSLPIDGNQDGGTIEENETDQDNMLNNDFNVHPLTRLIGERSAVRLYESVIERLNRNNVNNSNTQDLNNSNSNSIIRNISPIISPTLNNSANNLTSVLESFRSSNELGQTCRICRYIDSSLELIPCPCSCTGSVGYIHRKCLQRWMRFRQSSRCEICKEPYQIQFERRKPSLLIASLFRPKYSLSILRHFFSLAAVTPLVYFTINQLLCTMDNFNENPSTLKMVFIGPAMLLGTSIYFFLYFDWAISCLFRIRNVLLHWWYYGDQDDDDLIPNIDDFHDYYDFEL